MRGSDRRSGVLFSYVDLENRVRRDRPLRSIRQLVDAALEALSGDFSGLYSGDGSSFDTAGDAAAGHAAAGVLLDPLGTAVDGDRFTLPDLYPDRRNVTARILPEF